MVIKRLKITLPKPKVSLDRLGQLVFTFKEVTKLALKTNKNLLILAFILNALWGFSAAPGFYLEKLILDRLVENIGNPNWQTALNMISILIILRLLLELTRNILSRISGFLRRALSRQFDAEINVQIGKKLAELDYNLVSGGTDNHLMLVDLRNKGITGKQAEKALEEAGITVNKNTVPFDPQKPMITSGIRIATPAVTTRGMKEKDMGEIAEMMNRVLNDTENQKVKDEVRKEVESFCERFV